MKMISLMPVTFVFALALSACATRTSNPTNLYGQAAPATAAEEIIVITPATEYVNVAGGKVVKFVVGDKEFSWDFDGSQTIDNFALNDVAPPGVLDHPVRVFVSPDLYRSGGGA